MSEDFLDYQLQDIINDIEMEKHLLSCQDNVPSRFGKDWSDDVLAFESGTTALNLAVIIRMSRSSRLP